ncbi:N-acetyltransferase [Winogradskyella sp. F6397]|uniref:N-acetyltransferase n=1 Tax=Winogradskyella marina TaxID=2785530 RepID=A0ABS0EHS5_9FLAO|nr:MULTISPECIES: GNAT family N-acetyltransferase [Winogradskyella]MBF8149984.1 N-acetyltransferase [Winogradskyella marina]
MELKHIESKSENKFYLLDGDKEIGEMTYVYTEDQTIDLNHTEIDSAYRGQSLGQKLINAAIDFLIKNNLKATASCPYAKKMLERSEQYSAVKV